MRSVFANLVHDFAPMHVLQTKFNSEVICMHV